MAYPGGKGGAGVAQQIISLMPPHRYYAEIFLGGASVAKLKRPAEINVGIDLSQAAIDQARPALQASFELRMVDARHWLQRERPGPDWLIYCDPPYLMEVRKTQKRIYQHEFGTEGEHWQLLAQLRSLKAMVMISGYRCELYDREMLADWRRHDFTTSNRAGQRVTESVWMNFPAPLALHDYRFLGSNFRERERIKRKKARWRARLSKMPILERMALLATIADIAGSSEQVPHLAGPGEVVPQPKFTAVIARSPTKLPTP